MARRNGIAPVHLKGESQLQPATLVLDILTWGLAAGDRLVGQQFVSRRSVICDHTRYVLKLRVVLWCVEVNVGALLKAVASRQFVAAGSLPILYAIFHAAAERRSQAGSGGAGKKYRKNTAPPAEKISMDGLY